jgi:hypothetical protein
VKKHLTEIVFILDRSGSMAGLEDDTIGGFNALIAKQKQEAGEALVSTFLFDNESQLIHDRLDIRQVPPLTRQEYYVRGCTALLDTVGKAVEHLTTAAADGVLELACERPDFILTDEAFEQLVKLHLATCEKREMLGMSSHLLYVGRKVGAKSDSCSDAAPVLFSRMPIRGTGQGAVRPLAATSVCVLGANRAQPLLRLKTAGR